MRFNLYALPYSAFECLAITDVRKSHKKYRKVRASAIFKAVQRLVTSYAVANMAESRKRRKLSDGEYEETPAQSVGADLVNSSTDTTDQRHSLFVRSLPASVTSASLAEQFSQNYPLKHATVVVDPKTKISRGFGFVTFTDPEDAQLAAAELNNSTIDGRRIKVEVAESRHRELAGEGQRGRINLKAAELKAQREKQETDTQPPRLIVRNLPWSIKDGDDLALLFRSYGKVKHSVVPKKNAKEQAGFGFVVIRGKKNAERAIQGLNGKVVDGRTLAVDWAVDKDTWQNLQQSQKQVESQPLQAAAADEPLTNGHAADGLAVAPEDQAHHMEGSDLVSEDISELSGGELNSNAEDEEEDVEPSTTEIKDTSKDTTIFVRNLPFETDDEILREHFKTFGPIRYARVVYDQSTERSRGTGFVCFFNEDDAKECVRSGPKPDQPSGPGAKPGGSHSILQNEALDSSGSYTLEGRVLHVSRALSKEAATARTEENLSKRRETYDRDKRRLYLLSEGTIAAGSKLYDKIGKAELDIREASARQRRKLIKTNPNLGISLTRLSVRNMPRGIGSKELKALAREAVVGFATDVKNGVRQALSAEERSRGGDEMKEAERKRKLKGVGIVTQAKIVFEGREGGKVKEDSGAGRSRGYGFIEYSSHRWALMGLRWLNGHLVKGAEGDRGKRLIVEFAIENAQVVRRRGEREKKVEKVETGRRVKGGDSRGKPGKEVKGGGGDGESKTGQKKRKRAEKPKAKDEAVGKQPAVNAEEKNKVAKRNRIIAKKRQARKARP